MISKTGEIYKQAILDHLLKTVVVHTGQNVLATKLYKNKDFQRHLYDQFMSGYHNTNYNSRDAVGISHAISGVVPETAILGEQSKTLGTKMRKLLSEKNVQVNFNNLTAREQVQFRRALRGDFNWLKNRSFVDKFGPVLMDMVPGYGHAMHEHVKDLVRDNVDLSGIIKDLNHAYNTNPLSSQLVRGVTDHFSKTVPTTAMNSNLQRKANKLGRVIGSAATFAADPVAGSVNMFKNFIGSVDKNTLMGIPKGNQLVKLKEDLHHQFVTKPLSNAWDKGLQGLDHVTPTRHTFNTYVINPITSHAADLANSYGKIFHKHRGVLRRVRQAPINAANNGVTKIFKVLRRIH